MSKLNYMTKKSERMGYYSYFLGQNIIYIFVTLFLSVYYTSALGIPPAAVATILLVARVWDAINDPMLSIFIEKANLKGGKFKPWIKSVAFLIPVLTVLLFSFTSVLAGSTLGFRIAFASVTYILWGMVYTISDAPAFALATVMTSDMDEKNSIISFSRIGALIGILIAMVAGPIVVDLVGGNWLIASVILSVLAFIFLIQVNRTTERVKSKQHSPTLKQIVGAIVGNKYLVVIVATIVLMNGFNFGMTVTPFLAEHVFGDVKLTSAIMGISILPMLVGALLLPRFAKKYGKNILMKFSMVIVIVFSLITFFVAKENITLFLILALTKGLLSSFVLIIGTLYFADAIEYEFYKSGSRFEAAVFSAQTFSNKAMGAVAGAGGMYLLALFGFKESMAGEVVVQTQQAIDGIWMTYTIGPVIGATLALVVFAVFYDMDEKKLKKMGEESGRLNSNIS